MSLSYISVKSKYNVLQGLPVLVSQTFYFIGQNWITCSCLNQSLVRDGISMILLDLSEFTPEVAEK